MFFDISLYIHCIVVLFIELRKNMFQHFLVADGEIHLFMKLIPVGIEI